MRTLILLLALMTSMGAAEKPVSTPQEVINNGTALLLTPTPEAQAVVASAVGGQLGQATLTQPQKESLQAFITGLIDLYAMTWNDRERLKQEAKSAEETHALELAQCQRTRTFTKLANPNLYEFGVACYGIGHLLDWWLGAVRRELPARPQGRAVGSCGP